MANSHEVLRRVQEETQRRLAERRNKFRFSVKPVELEPESVVQPEPEPIPKVDIGKVTSDAARRYIGDLSEKFQDVASQVVRALQTDRDFVSAVRDQDGQVSLYPPNCKLVVEDPSTGNGSIVIEEGPQMRTLLTYNDQVRVPMPYIVFVIGYRRSGRIFSPRGVGVGFGVKPIESIDDFLLMPHLPHVQGNRHVCQPMAIPKAKSVAELGLATVNVFWQSSFVYKFGSSFTLDGQTITGFPAWERIAKKNPLDILRADFGKGEKLRNVIKAFSGMETRKRKGTTNYGEQIQIAVQRVLHETNAILDADELAKVISDAIGKVQNSALQQS